MDEETNGIGEVVDQLWEVLEDGISAPKQALGALGLKESDLGRALQALTQPLQDKQRVMGQTTVDIGRWENEFVPAGLRHYKKKGTK